MATTMTQRLPRPVSLVAWLAVVALGTLALAMIALSRGESIDALWFIVAAVCVYALGYRFYSAFLAAKVFALDPTRATPAEHFSDGRDFVPTNRWVVFGHHFAAIAGPGPLIGPTLAAQFGQTGVPAWNRGDFNFDQRVNLADFNLLAGQFGQTASVAEGGDDPFDLLG